MEYTLFLRLPGRPCCDNCDETLNQVNTICITQPYLTRAQQDFKPSEELKASVAAALLQWRIDALHTYYPEQHIITFEHLLDNTVIEKISSRPGIVKQCSIFQQVIPWALGLLRPDLGNEVVNLVTELVKQDPDQLAQEVAEQEHHGERLLAMMAQDYPTVLLFLKVVLLKSVNLSRHVD
ncbi:hypothetical protein AAF712_014851 [Marasmius tenuissimus]|uniref:Uncharacterized protein n=1 Tax=Marasmius tenuissimus TaxID=585030 RepID=A0ABR2ZAT4_9AGAR